MLFLLGFFNVYKNKTIKIGFSDIEGKFFISNEVKHDMYNFLKRKWASQKSAAPFNFFL